MANLNAKEYHQAAEMFAVDGRATMLTEWQPKAATAWLPDVSGSDYVLGWIRGRRRVELTVTYPGPDRDEAGYYHLESGFRGMHVIAYSRDHNFKSSNVSNEVE